jgi:hypothetical protein
VDARSGDPHHQLEVRTMLVHGVHDLVVGFVKKVAR